MPAWLTTVLAGLTMFLGLIGIIIPVLPDMLLIWGAALFYGLAAGWGVWGPAIFAVITLLGAIGLVADLWMSGWGARKGGASIRSILVGLLFGAVGFVLLTPLGGVLLLLVATFAMEYARLNDAEKALRGMLGMGLGYGASFGVKIGLGLLMLGLWVLWVIVR